MKPTYEELEAELVRTQELLKKALDRIATLEDQINKNSKNSSKPPSSDQKSNTQNNPKKKRNSRPGKARPLYPPERIDRYIDCICSNCPHCQSNNLNRLNELPAIWQQAELPDSKAIVTQFNRHRYSCGECGKSCLGDLPEGIPFSAFGPKLMALIVMLTGRFHMSKRDVMALVKDLYDIDTSEGSVINIEKIATEALDEVYERIHRFVIQGLMPRYFDETSWRDSGKRHYVWIATNELAAFYQIDARRSQEALLKIVGTHTKVACVTDRYSAYNAIDGPRQYCLAHLIRDFHAFAEQEGETGEIAAKIENELRKACKIDGDSRKGEISRRQRGQRLAHSKRRLSELFLDAIAFGSKKLEDFCWRLDDEFDRLWTFASVEGMEPTNNLAERDLRKIVLWRNKSYGTRSEGGKRFVERITSVVETVKKSGNNILNFLEEALDAFFHKKSAPFINPIWGF